MQHPRGDGVEVLYQGALVGPQLLSLEGTHRSLSPTSYAHRCNSANPRMNTIHSLFVASSNSTFSNVAEQTHVHKKAISAIPTEFKCETQGCQIKILEIGIFLLEFGKILKNYQANSEKNRKVVFKLLGA